VVAAVDLHNTVRNTETHDSNPARTWKRLLVIDDSALIREAVRIALEDVEVLSAASAEEGLAVANREQPDAILLDVVLPGIDGHAAARRLAGAPATRSIPVVMLTGLDSERGTLASVRGVIAKPFAVSSLAGELGALLGWPA
jgi:CheY-like chemotaxis protein